MSGKLDGRVAVITGASSGIGLAIARLFVAEGAFVFITGRRQRQLDEAANAIGGNVIAVQGDAGNLADLDRLFDAVRREKGRLDILCANAGAAAFGAIGEVTAQQVDTVFDVNVKGTLFAVQKALPLMSDGGSIIMTGSIGGVRGRANFGVYAASKAAIRSFARTWTNELKARRIRVNVVSPGPTETTAFENVPAEVKARIASEVPMGRMARPDEIAKAALFLASDDSSFVTGIELFVDGGTAQV
jgi:NAD(P)-dependent dehydrogenase (short-subunit alcohol dehydrogenase family)